MAAVRIPDTCSRILERVAPAGATLISTVALVPGARVGIYEITAPIGEGGMGAVYRAHDTQLGRDVALKVLPDSFSNDPDRVARFTREAHVLASLDHPNIAKIYGLERFGTNQIIVVEMVWTACDTKRLYAPVFILAAANRASVLGGT